MDFIAEACCLVGVGILSFLLVHCIVNFRRGITIVENWATNEDNNPLIDRTAPLPSRRGVIHRLKQDYRLLNERHYDDPEIHASPIDENNMLLWKAVIVGPQDTPFENGIFSMLIEFSNDYPYAPPSKIVFISRMFHPNVSSTGPRIVIRRNSEIIITRHGEVILGNDMWNPGYDVYTILKAIQNLLGFPDVADEKNYLNPEAAKLFKEK